VPPEEEVRERGYLGVKVDDQGDRGPGVLIMEVFADSPAAESGLQSEDLITATKPVRKNSKRSVSKTPSGRDRKTSR
jgi:S1-C subfamily serine protease